MERLLTQWILRAAFGVEAAAGVLIILAVLQAFLRAIGLLFRGTPSGSHERVQAALGRWLSLALAFELAADVLRTAVTPTWDEIGQLAAIILLRTTLNYFLRKELEAERPPRMEPIAVGHRPPPERHAERGAETKAEVRH